MINDSQKAVVLRFLNENGSITSKDANTLGISRLAAVIFQIKKDGIGIETANETVMTRYGTTTIARYSLCQD